MKLGQSLTLSYGNPQYQAPGPHDLSLLVRELNWSERKVAETIGERTGVVEQWLSGKRSIPYAEWRLLLIESGIVPKAAECKWKVPCELNSQTLQSWASGRYSRPGPKDVKELKAASNWTQQDMAKTIGVGSNEKGSPSVRKLLSPEGSKAHVPIRYASWRLLLISAGIV